MSYVNVTRTWESPVTDLDLDRLRKIAENATPGPWRFQPAGDYECGEPQCCYEDWDNRVLAGQTIVSESDQLSDEDAQYIATFDPPTVLAMIKRLRGESSD